MNNLLSKSISNSSFNTTNAWGFGGGFGVEHVFQNGSKIRIGTACYRHAKAHTYVTAYTPDGRRVFDESGGLSADKEIKIAELLNL
jgi:hypothetical protein